MTSPTGAREGNEPPLSTTGSLLTLREGADLVGVSVEAVRLWVRRGQVLTVEWDGRLWLTERSLYECERARRRQPRGRRRAETSKETSG